MQVDVNRIYLLNNAELSPFQHTEAISYSDKRQYLHVKHLPNRSIQKNKQIILKIKKERQRKS